MKDFLFSLAPSARAWWRWVGTWRGPTLRLLADYRWCSDMLFGQWYFIEPRCFEGFATILYFFRFCWPIFAKTPAWTLFWDCSCWRSAMLIWVATLTSLLNWCNEFLTILSWQVIELRSLGWKPDPTVEKYYEERFVCFPSVVGCWACNKPIIVDLQFIYSRAFCSILTWTLVY